MIVVGGIVVALRRRRHTFKGDYSTKKHVYGNGSFRGASQPRDGTHISCLLHWQAGSTATWEAFPKEVLPEGP